MLRVFAFFTVLILPILITLPLFVQLTGIWVPEGFKNLITGDAIAVLIARTAPLLAEDASLLGEVTPVAIAGMLTFMAPKKSETKLI